MGETFDTKQSRAPATPGTPGESCGSSSGPYSNGRSGVRGMPLRCRSKAGKGGRERQAAERADSSGARVTLTRSRGAITLGTARRTTLGTTLRTTRITTVAKLGAAGRTCGFGKFTSGPSKMLSPCGADCFTLVTFAFECVERRYL